MSCRSVFRRPFYVVDDENLRRRVRRFELESQLFLERRKQVRNVANASRRHRESFEAGGLEFIDRPGEIEVIPPRDARPIHDRSVQEGAKFAREVAHRGISRGKPALRSHGEIRRPARITGAWRERAGAISDGQFVNRDASFFEVRGELEAIDEQPPNHRLPLTRARLALPARLGGDVVLLFKPAGCVDDLPPMKLMAVCNELHYGPVDREPASILNLDSWRTLITRCGWSDRGDFKRRV